MADAYVLRHVVFGCREEFYQDTESILESAGVYLDKAQAEQAAKDWYAKINKQNYDDMVKLHPTPNYAPYDPRHSYGGYEGHTVRVVRMPLNEPVVAVQPQT